MGRDIKLTSRWRLELDNSTHFTTMWPVDLIVQHAPKPMHKQFGQTEKHIKYRTFNFAFKTHRISKTLKYFDEVISLQSKLWNSPSLYKHRDICLLHYGIHQILKPLSCLISRSYASKHRARSWVSLQVPKINIQIKTQKWRKGVNK